MNMEVLSYMCVSDTSSSIVVDYKQVAAFALHIDTAQFLLEQAVDPNRPRNNGE